MLPEGSDFGFLIKNNMIYVDKTDIIHGMVKREKHVFLSRPRGFGKSLLLSTLAYLFKGGPSNAVLFEGTKIKETFKYQFPEYTVLRFDFSDLDSETPHAFEVSLQKVVGDFFREYGVDEKGCANGTHLKRCTDRLLTTLYQKTERKNVVLVDEYDQPYRNFGGNEKDQSEMLNIMREFFIILKANDDIIQFCFVTGTTKIALADSFSGYNCAHDISWLPHYETIVGFSQNEVKTYFSGFVEDRAKELGMSVDELYQLLDVNFEGYRFSLENEKMYDPQAIIDFFKNGTYQKQTDSYVLEEIRKMPELAMVLDFMLELGEEDGKIPVTVSFINGHKQSFTGPLATLKVLYEAGFFSVKDYKSGKKLIDPDEYYIGFTNQLTANHYRDLLSAAFQGEIWSSLRFKAFLQDKDPGFQEPLEKRDMPSFLKKVHSHFMGVPHVLISENEKLVESFYQLILYYGLRLSRMKTNWETILSTGRLEVIAENDQASYLFEVMRKNNPEWKNAMHLCNLHSYRECSSKRQTVCIGIVFEETPTKSERKIHAWGMFEKSFNGSFHPNRNSFEMTKYRMSQ